MKLKLLIPLILIANICFGVGKCIWNEPDMTKDFSILQETKYMKLIDLTGQKIGRLTVIARAESRRKPSGQVTTMWRCLCQCGNELITSNTNLRSGDTKSCGCYNLENIKQMHVTHGHTAKRDMSQEYKCYQAMKSRCNYPNSTSYPNYGAKGVKVCDRWLNSFGDFLTDMGKRPSAKHSLDRYPNKHGNYEPGNVRWATDGEQSRNKTNNVWIEHNGMRMVQKDWAVYMGMGQSVLSSKMKYHSFEEIYNQHMNKKTIA